MRLSAAAIACLLVISCSDDEMQDVPHFRPMQESILFADGTSARTPPQGTLARGQLDTDVALHYGREPTS
ncbi:MAG: cytochrome c, partial [Hyphomicrobiales bacterium]